MNEPNNLPRALDDGLTLRWATAEDVEALAHFNVAMHSDDYENDPEIWLADWTRDLMSGRHPTTGPGDFTVVTDVAGAIISSLCLISQTWQYDGIPFAVGRPELIGTHPDYRRRGLVKRQMEITHSLSAARGELVQAITGIPWYYRRFGYELALDRGGQRLLPYDRAQRLKRPDPDPFEVRPATEADLPLLQTLYAIFTAPFLVSRVRDARELHYEMCVALERTVNRRQFYVVQRRADGEPAGYFEFFTHPEGYYLREIAARPGCSLRDVALCAAHYLFRQVVEKTPEGKPRPQIIFALGCRHHPAYDALPRLLQPDRAPFAWYVRVPDLRAFLRHIAPALERRLAGSVIAGFSGTLRLNLFAEHLALVFEQGHLKEIGSFVPERLEAGDATFPDLTFLHLLFGHRSLQELRHAFADVGVRSEEAEVLLDVLFPSRPSAVIGLG